MPEQTLGLSWMENGAPQYRVLSDLLIGRGADCDLVLEQRSISRHHVRISEDGGWFIEDLDSSYGTRLNGEVLTPHQKHALTEGDSLDIGRQHFTLTRGLQPLFNPEDDKTIAPTLDLNFTSGRLGEETGRFTEAFHTHLDSLIDDPELRSALKSRTAAAMRQFSEFADHKFREYEVLQDITAILTRIHNVAELLSTALNLLSKALDADRGCILIHDERSGSLQPMVTRHFGESGAVPEHDVAFSRAIANSCYERREVIFIHDALIDERFVGSHSIMASGIRGAVALPLELDQRVAGVVYLDSLSKAGCFHTHQTDFLKTFSHQTAIALENARVNASLSRFVPREFLRLLGRDQITQVQFGDQVQRAMTVMFADIRSFTSLSEQMTPEQCFNFLNAYLQRVAPVIKKHGGFIDKFIGDGIMALFPENPESAVAAALDMLAMIRIYNSHRAKTGYDPIEVNMGIHTGELILGAIGYEQRMEGTVIADAVNLASRLEGLTKQFKAKIIISNETYRGIEKQDLYSARFLGKVRVKGKAHMVDVLEICEPGKETDLKMKTRKIFETGVKAYLKKDRAKVLAFMRQTLAINPSDHAARHYLDLINVK